jgi:hypothetical protein
MSLNGKLKTLLVMLMVTSAEGFSIIILAVQDD